MMKLKGDIYRVVPYERCWPAYDGWPTPASNGVLTARKMFSCVAYFLSVIEADTSSPCLEYKWFLNKKQSFFFPIQDILKIKYSINRIFL